MGKYMFVRLINVLTVLSFPIVFFFLLANLTPEFLPKESVILRDSKAVCLSGKQEFLREISNGNLEKCENDICDESVRAEIQFYCKHNISVGDKRWEFQSDNILKDKQKLTSDEIDQEIKNMMDVASNESYSIDFHIEKKPGLMLLAVTIFVAMFIFYFLAFLLREIVYYVFFHKSLSVKDLFRITY